MERERDELRDTYDTQYQDRPDGISFQSGSQLKKYEGWSKVYRQGFRGKEDPVGVPAQFFFVLLMNPNESHSGKRNEKNSGKRTGSERKSEIPSRIETLVEVSVK